MNIPLRPIDVLLGDASRHWVLGADDPEMRAIEKLLAECEQRVSYAATKDGQRVTHRTMYQAVGVTAAADVEPAALPGTAWYLVECDFKRGLPSGVIRGLSFDHHRPGDFGFGSPPADYLRASTLGQVVEELARFWLLPFSVPGTIQQVGGQWSINGPDGHTYIPDGILFTAAADHCHRAAYRGECPGVKPAELLEYRLNMLAEQWGRSVAFVRGEHEKSVAALRDPPLLLLAPKAPPAADLRGAIGPEALRSLQEASAATGIGCVLGPVDGKVVCYGGPEQVVAFKRWARGQHLVDVYADPVRGFAGGYCP